MKKGITRPTKPRVPRLPELPQKTVKEFQIVGKGMRLSQVTVRDLLAKIAKEAGSQVNELDLDNTVLYFGYDVTICVGKYISVRNPHYASEQASYNKRLEKYHTNLTNFDKRMKLYNINLPIWQAWKVSEEQDVLLQEVEQTKIKINKLEEKKKLLLSKVKNKNVSNIFNNK